MILTKERAVEMLRETLEAQGVICDHGQEHLASTIIAAMEQCHREACATDAEPFGYFRALPFCWEDCAETDEGAIALFAAPQPDRVAELEKVNAQLHCDVSHYASKSAELEAMVSNADNALLEAGERVGIIYGSDTPRLMADRIEELEGDVAVRGELVEALRKERDEALDEVALLRKALERIAGFSMSQFGSHAAIASECISVAQDAIAAKGGQS